MFRSPQSRFVLGTVAAMALMSAILAPVVAQHGQWRTVTARVEHSYGSGPGIHAVQVPGNFTVPPGYRAVDLRYRFSNPRNNYESDRLGPSHIYSVTANRYMSEVAGNPNAELPPGDYRFAVGGSPGATGTLSFRLVGSSPPTGDGAMILNVAGVLTRSDPRDRVRTNSHAKVYLVNLRGGMNYRIDLESGGGRSGPHNSGFFDTYLRVENAAGHQLAVNDDGGEGLNSRLQFRPNVGGSYRLVVTSYQGGATGHFRLMVRAQ